MNEDTCGLTQSQEKIAELEGAVWLWFLFGRSGENVDVFVFLVSLESGGRGVER